MLNNVQGPMLVTPSPIAFNDPTQADRDAARLKDGARQFEAMLLGEMLKPLQFGGAPGAEGESGGANDTLRSFGTEAVAKAIAGGKGFGIGSEILRQVTAQQETRTHGG